MGKYFICVCNYHNIFSSITFACTNSLTFKRLGKSSFICLKLKHIPSLIPNCVYDVLLLVLFDDVTII